jgi:hypothetical protein
MIVGLECDTNKKCNVHIFKTFSNISFYKQKKCVFCCDNFKGDVVILPCKHIFDLRCFITYTKLNYLENKNKKIKCPICKVESNILDLFKKYKLILDFRLLMIQKRKFVKNVYIHNNVIDKINEIKQNEEIKETNDTSDTKDTKECLK